MSRRATIALACGYVATVLWLGSRPSLAPGAFWDKGVHFTMFAGFGAVVALTTRPNAATPRVVAFAALVALALSAGDEWMQSFVPHRTADPFDVLADVSGAAVGACALVFRRTRRRRRVNDGAAIEGERCES